VRRRTIEFPRGPGARAATAAAPAGAPARGRPRFVAERRATTLAALASLLVAAHAGSVVLQVVDRWRDDLAEARAARPREVRVPVAAAEIPVGRTIEARDLLLVAQREAFLAPSVHRELEPLVGRVAAERILAGDLVREERLAPVGAGTELNAVVGTGMRAQSVNLADSASVSGFVQPGNRVDVITTLVAEDGTPGETTTLLQAVRVLAVDDGLAREKLRSIKIRPQVTLEVGPEDAQRLAAATQGAAVRLTLRGDTDLDVPPVTPVRTSELWTAPVARAAPWVSERLQSRVPQ
jgi:pilus assembly protein CpaB